MRRVSFAMPAKFLRNAKILMLLSYVPSPSHSHRNHKCMPNNNIFKRKCSNLKTILIFNQGGFLQARNNLVRTSINGEKLFYSILCNN